ncbi:hypothetical protein BC833DRAFT_592784 [Globomyces pollinis-pini]|nr:hypothetical protein BC833DRAFT_592784 [Globomyces pollinis-pini]
MVVLAASICTKQGKAILSRQFVEMTRSRIEGLLASFPKLIGANDQHTFVETDSVRYVYQPLDDLFIILITNKNSNILQDIDTLHLFSRIVSEYCRSADEKEITKQRFELLMVFDEVISLGFRENVNLGQIKTISAMESNDERIQAEIQKQKEREAKEELKRRAQLMDLKKWEAAKNARKGYPESTSGGFNNFSSSSSYNQSASVSPVSHTPEPSRHYPETPAEKSAPAPVGRGMKLGKKSVQSSLIENIKAEEGVRDSPVTTPSMPIAHAPSPAVHEETIHVTVEEKITATANRDGGLQSMEVNGAMMLKVNDPDQARVILKLSHNHDPNVQFNTHPNVDKALWANATTIALRDPSRPFPAAQPLRILKWRYTSRDESKLPLLVNCWPSPTGNGSCDVTIEYELQNLQIVLDKVTIMIPYSGAPPNVNHSDIGTFSIDKSTQSIIWQIPHLDASNSSGCLEFSIDTEDISTVYPIQMHFASTTSFDNLKIVDVNSVDGGPVTFSTDIVLLTNGYEIV